MHVTDLQYVDARDHDNRNSVNRWDSAMDEASLRDFGGSQLEQTYRAVAPNSPAGSPERTRLFVDWLCESLRRATQEVGSFCYPALEEIANCLRCSTFSSEESWRASPSQPQLVP